MVVLGGLGCGVGCWVHLVLFALSLFQMVVRVPCCPLWWVILMLVVVMDKVSLQYAQYPCRASDSSRLCNGLVLGQSQNQTHIEEALQELPNIFPALSLNN